MEPVLLPVPLSKGLRIALIVETSNAEGPTQNVIVIPIRYESGSMNRPYTIWAVYKHPQGRPHCFVFDNQFEFAKFLLSQNQSVQKTPMSMMSAPQLF